MFMNVAQMLNELEETTSEINGALVEDNRFCVSVHYRHVLQEVQVKLIIYVGLLFEK